MPIEPNTKASLYSTGSKSADTNLLTTNVTPSQSPVDLRLTVQVDTGSVVNATVWNGSAKESLTLHDGTALDAGELYVLPIPGAQESLEYNVELGTGASVDYLVVDELPSAMAGEPQ